MILPPPNGTYDGLRNATGYFLFEKRFYYALLYNVYNTLLIKNTYYLFYQIINSSIFRVINANDIKTNTYIYFIALND